MIESLEDTIFQQITYVLNQKTEDNRNPRIVSL